MRGRGGVVGEEEEARRAFGDRLADLRLAREDAPFPRVHRDELVDVGFAIEAAEAIGLCRRPVQDGEFVARVGPLLRIVDDAVRVGAAQAEIGRLVVDRRLACAEAVGETRAAASSVAISVRSAISAMRIGTP